jgi:hypothetical protein
MASKTVLMTALFDQLTSLVKEMIEMYPEDDMFPFYLTTISLMKNTNPSMFVKYINDNIGPYEKQITNREEKFFLDRSFSEYDGHFDLNIFSKLKQYIAGMSPESKLNVWKYTENIMRLAQASR